MLPHCWVTCVMCSALGDLCPLKGLWMLDDFCLILNLINDLNECRVNVMLTDSAFSHVLTETHPVCNLCSLARVAAPRQCGRDEIRWPVVQVKWLKLVLFWLLSKRPDCIIHLQACTAQNVNNTPCSLQTRSGFFGSPITWGRQTACDCVSSNPNTYHSVAHVLLRASEDQHTAQPSTAQYSTAQCYMCWFIRHKHNKLTLTEIPPAPLDHVLTMRNEFVEIYRTIIDNSIILIVSNILLFYIKHVINYSYNIIV